MMRPGTALALVALLVVGVAVLASLPTEWLDPVPDPTADPVPETARAESAPSAFSVTETVLEPRETLERALLRSGLTRADAAGILATLRGKVDLRRLRPGERVRVERTPDERVVSVTHRRSPVIEYEIRRDGDEWISRLVETPVEVRVAALAGRLEDSLFASMEQLGESASLTARFVALFEWDFDFAADSLPGDRFRLLVEKQYARGEFIGYGDVLIAQYHSVERSLLTSVGFEDAAGRTAYYDADGRSVRKMFLRAPLDFTRITSGFSHARRHPILGGLRPHLAIDYGAPTGTPVRAVADGVVESARWIGGNGLSITLRHARGYKTMYNHLSKVSVRGGQRVRQRDIIGRVGSTGLSTGPHLDYRVMKNGRFVNPLSEKFIPGAPVPRERRKGFQAHLDGLLDRLEREAVIEPERERS
jgi:murein DD-endopeptidase MepM/ murein hydrolase activator NlpD